MVTLIETWKKKLLTVDMAVIAVLTLLASFIGSYLKQFPGLKLLGALIIALLIGMILQLPLKQWYVRTQDSRKAGVKSAAGIIANKLLRLGIILIGFKLNLHVLFTQGLKCLPVAAFIVAFGLLLTYAIARLFKVSPQLAILTAGGSSICGAAAVMGLSGSLPVDAKDEDEKAQNEVIAVATVAIMGTIFALADIVILPKLGLNKNQLGVASGASLHEIAHAVAAGDAFGAVEIATIMKLARVLMLVPVAIIVAIWWNARHATNARGTSHSIALPWFMLGFIAASILGTFVPQIGAIAPALVEIGYIVLGMAMAALGINVNFKVIAQHGRTAFLASLLASIALTIIACMLAAFIF